MRCKVFPLRWWQGCGSTDSVLVSIMQAQARSAEDLTCGRLLAVSRVGEYLTHPPASAWDM